MLRSSFLLGQNKVEYRKSASYVVWKCLNSFTGGWGGVGWVVQLITLSTPTRVEVELIVPIYLWLLVSQDACCTVALVKIILCVFHLKNIPKISSLGCSNWGLLPFEKHLGRVTFEKYWCCLPYFIQLGQDKVAYQKSAS